MPSPVPTQTPSPSPARSVRISFVPPPLEGTISLGIYDRAGKLVRVLYREAQLDQFQIGADALVTQWDGKSNNGQDVPAAKYRARGYLVGRLKVEDVGQAAQSTLPKSPDPKVKVKLIPNPLANDKRSTIELAAAFDADGTYLETSDDLPLFTVNKSPNLRGVSLAKAGEKSIDILEDTDTGLHRFRISDVDQMMAFDCGEVELK
ncbi:MAG TPA: hypothetical protein VH227_05440 [Candidatus Udaeobacter sp.]|jgi:hypothetical protein|nr:hypothetical protein [Candidatus Udaeobacter sp.]